jgi:hypothetical protein
VIRDERLLLRLASQTTRFPFGGLSFEPGQSIRQGCIVAVLIVQGESGPWCLVMVESPGGVPEGKGAKRRLQMRLAEPTARPLAGGSVVGRQADRLCRMVLGTVDHFRHFRHLDWQAFRQARELLLRAENCLPPFSKRGVWGDLTIPGRIPLDPPFPKGDDEWKRKLFCAPRSKRRLQMHLASPNQPSSRGSLLRHHGKEFFSNLLEESSC